MKTLNSEKELLSFLNKIAKKSIINASNNLFEQDSYVNNFKKKLESELENLEEQDEEEEPPLEDEETPEDEDEEEAPAEDEEVEPIADEEETEPVEDEEETEVTPAKTSPKKPKKNPAAEKALSLPAYESGQTVEFDQVLSAINLVRAGNSTKSKKTKDEIAEYFERLDKEERAVLSIYLKELAKIMTGAVDGDSAQDPSDPTAYFDIVTKPPANSKKSGGEPNEIPGNAEPLNSPEKMVKSKTQMSGEEDITPPFKVNEQQSYRGLKKVRG